MANRVIFRLKKESKIKFKEGYFQEENQGIWLSVSTDSINCDIAYICDDTKDLDKDKLLSMISDTKIYSLLRSNLSDYEFHEIYEVYRFSNEYYLDIGDSLTIIKKLDKEAINQYITSFKNDVRDAVKTHSSENITIAYDWDYYRYELIYSREDGETALINSYAMNYIPEETLNDLVSELDISYFMD